MPGDTVVDPPEIADLRHLNAELQQRLDEAAQRETAIAEVLGVINSSAGDLAPVFDAILEKAHALCDATLGGLLIRDGEEFRVAAVQADQAFAEAWREMGRLRPPEASPLGRVARGEGVVQIADAREDEFLYRDAPPLLRRLRDIGDVRTLLIVPLLKDDALLGAITAFRQEVRPFSDKQIALLQNFAAQAVIAMENARLITETREALEQQTATAEVLGVINSSPGNLVPVFDAMLDKALRLCASDFGGLATYDGQHFHTVATRNFPEALVEFLKTPLPAPPAGGGPLGRLIAGDDIVETADLSDDETDRAAAPARRMMVELGGARSAIWVALRKDDTLIGMFVIYRRERRPFSDKEIALLQNFAAQAVIAMENARLITETREALEQQTATAEVLGVINSSPGDLTPVFDAILEKAHGLCGAVHGDFWMYNGDTFDLAATHGEPRFAGWLRDQGPFRAWPGSPMARLVEGEDCVLVENPAEDPSYQTVPEFLEQVKLNNIGTALFVSLRNDKDLLGIVVVYRLEVRPFSDKQIALLQNFAAQAVIAMENARLLTETREALEQQTATAEVLRVINSSPGDLKPVFDAMLDKALQLCEADFGTLQTHEDGFFEPVAATGDASFVKRVLSVGRLPLSRGVTHERIAKGAPVVHLADIREDSVYLAGSADMRAVSDAAGLRTLLSVALRKDDQVLGQISVYRKEVRPFDDKQIALLENFAVQAVIAMENARLLGETREALEQQTATAEVLQVINASPGDLAPVFDAMLEWARGLCGAAFGTFMLRDGDRFSAAAVHGAVPLPFAAIVRKGFVPSPSSPIGRLREGEPFVHIADLAAAVSLVTDDPVPRQAVELGGIRTLLMVPLIKDGQLLGVFTNFRQEVRPFTDKQVSLLQNFAAQAVIAMENARLITETREALDQQTATAEVLGVINSSPGDLAPVFDAMLDKAMRLCGAAFGELQTYNAEHFEMAAIHGLPPRYAEFRMGRTHVYGSGTIPARLLAGERLIQVLDITDEDAYRDGEPNRLALADLGGARTVLAVPLVKDDALLGFIVVYRQEVRAFSGKQIVLLENFAQQAVIAMENARLLGELRERTEEVAGLNLGLEARVAAQLAELERAGKLRRFLAPQLADLIVAQGDESILESHRREIVVVFCDIRGFTAFAERAEPEEVMALLKEYHAALGPIVARFEGTLDHYGGDGVMVFFNDPLPTPDPAKRAIDMAVAMREAAAAVVRAWRRHGHDIGFGVGISQGYATLGQIGFAERMDYTAIGTVTNLAARLCGEAKDGQILISRRVANAVEETVKLEEIGDLSLKGLSQAVAVYNVV